MFGNKNLSIPELVERCKGGDQYAFKVLYDQYAPLMFGICMRYAHTREVAQDLMHDGFVRVFMSFSELKHPDALVNWMRRIMVNVAVNYVKRDLRHLDDLVDPANEAALADSSQDFDHHNVEYLLSVIQSLPAKYRVVFNLKEVEGYSFDEIATQLQIEPASVRSILSRARTMIKEKLEKDER